MLWDVQLFWCKSRSPWPLLQSICSGFSLLSPLVYYSLPQSSSACWQRWQMLSSGLQWVMCGEWMIHLQTRCEFDGDSLGATPRPCYSWGEVQIQHCLISFTRCSLLPFSDAGVSAERRKHWNVMINNGVPLKAALGLPFSLLGWWSLGRCYVQNPLIPAHTEQEWRWLYFCLMWDGAGQKYWCHP